MTQPEKLWCWNLQTEKGGWDKGWGGYSRPEPRYPLDERERNTGAEYVRADIVETTVKDVREKALREAAEICTGIIRDYDVMKPDGKTYEPLRVQKAAKGMVRLARQDILALIQVSASQNDKKEG